MISLLVKEMLMTAA